ncbi:hypothetical protein FG386_001764 [Cryptosporidium ryanae]|uniref:uncharacterized protein n=1 Tax=Cryptosporidium ryanae TaxID=515981 RepID=UPI00351A3CF5|nr:hypothetical protein FG386_001764 [Cryptosporidium ryanae]
MQANQIVELRALLSLRKVYEEGMILKINSGVPKYICLLSKLRGYNSPYFFDDELECWEGRECVITGEFKFTAEKGIDVSNESIRLIPEEYPFIVLLSILNNDLKNLGFELLRRQLNMIEASNNFFLGEFHDSDSSKCKVIDLEFSNPLNSDKEIFWKSIKVLWFGDCVIIGKNGVYSALGIEMPLKRTFTSVLISYSCYKNSKLITNSELPQLIVLLTLIIQLVSITRRIFNSNLYLPIFFSTDCILFEIAKSPDTGAIYFENLIITDIGEETKLDTIEYSTLRPSDYKLLPIQKNISTNKYLTPEIAISYFTNSLIKLSRKNNSDSKKNHTIYDCFSISTLKDALSTRIRNKWKPMIFSGDIKIENKSEFLKNQSFNENIVEMIINKDVDFIVNIGAPSVVFSIGLLISEVIGGKDLMFACDGDKLHFVDNLCEWNSCGDVMPVFGRVKEENVMNTLTGRRNHTVLDILPDNVQFLPSTVQSDQLLNRIHKLLWACLNFVPSQRLSLGQLENELIQIKGELFYIYQRSNIVRAENQTHRIKFEKVKTRITDMIKKFKSIKKISL